MLRTRSPLGLPEQAPWTSFDLHVLSTPPAFVLSQDQTLQQKSVGDLGGCVDRRTTEYRVQGRWNVPDSCDLDMIVFATGWDPAAELTSSLVSEAHRSEPPPTNCPHWRSVFSSVFKEPKLEHIRAEDQRGLVPCPSGGARPSVGR